MVCQISSSLHQRTLSEESLDEISEVQSVASESSVNTITESRRSGDSLSESLASLDQSRSVSNSKTYSEDFDPSSDSGTSSHWSESQSFSSRSSRSSRSASSRDRSGRKRRSQRPKKITEKDLRSTAHGSCGGHACGCVPVYPIIMPSHSQPTGPAIARAVMTEDALNGLVCSLHRLLI